MTFEPTSESSPDLPPDHLPTADDLPSDPAMPSFGAPAADDIATDDAAAPLGTPNPTQEPSAFAPPPHDAARDNAWGGHWAMSEWYDGWVFLGADGRPVVRNDGSRIGFRFADAERLAQELADAPEQEETADGSGRRALAPLDSRFNKDWDPQRPKSTLADMTKWTRLLAYHLVQTTEPEEAVRRAVSMIFGNPVTMDGRGAKLWVPTKYDAEAVKSLAGTLLRQVVGSEEEASGTQFRAPTMPYLSDGVSSLKSNPMKAGIISARVESSERSDIDRTLRNKGAKLRHERLDSDSLNSGPPPKAPPGVDVDVNIGEALKKKGDNSWFYDQVKNKGPWDYKQQGKDFENFGNFNYGATGAALGYTEATLLRMAGWAHGRSGNSQPEHGVRSSLPGAYLGIGGVAPFGDDPIDQYWIRRGYRYYKERQ